MVEYGFVDIGYAGQESETDDPQPAWISCHRNFLTDFCLGLFTVFIVVSCGSPGAIRQTRPVSVGLKQAEPQQLLITTRGVALVGIRVRFVVG